MTIIAAEASNIMPVAGGQFIAVQSYMSVTTSLGQASSSDDEPAPAWNLLYPSSIGAISFAITLLKLLIHPLLRPNTIADTLNALHTLGSGLHPEDVTDDSLREP